MAEKKPKTASRAMDLEKIERGVRLILEGSGDDPDRPGIKATPRRVAHMWAEVLGGINENPEKHLRAIQHERHDDEEDPTLHFAPPSPGVAGAGFFSSFGISIVTVYFASSLS